MRRAFLTSALLALLATLVRAEAPSDLSKLLTGPLSPLVAVEKLTGRDEGYDLGFSGWVGSLQFRLEENRIYISEFTKSDSRVDVVIGIYSVTRVERYPKSIDFDCIDVTLGIEWRGKAWLDESSRLRLEIVQKMSPRKWVNLGSHGKRFLTEAGLKHLNLGMSY
jgi:hypothetical protein